MGKKIISIMLTVLALFSTLSVISYASEELEVWDGKTKQPTQITTINGIYYYEISSAEELSYIAQMGGDWLGYNYILTNDIVLNNVELTYNSYGDLTVDDSTLNKWIPINGFEGIFDGARHTVSGVYVNTTSSAGFFANCSGDVSNLKITNSYIKGESDVGGICGSFNGIGKEMENCFFDGAVIGESNVGGLIGVNHCTYISNSGNYGDVWGTGDYVSGIVGYFYAYGIDDCFNEGNITSTGNYVAGIAGSSTTYNINGCINKGVIKGDNYVAGICGKILGAGLYGCGNTGNIIGTKYVGGICGYSIYHYVEDWSSFISYAYNTGIVTGESYVGGITGYTNYAGVHSGYNVGNVIGTVSTGAIIGYSESIWGKGSVNNCYYLKTDDVNSELNAFGNAPDAKGIANAKGLDFFCFKEDKTLNLEGHTYNNACDKTCNVCGATRIVDGHKEEAIKGRPATCTKSGFTDGKKCSVCGKVITAQKPIKATGHTFGAWKTTKQPTYTATGTQTRTCTKCSATENKTIAKKKTTSISKCTVSTVKPLTYTGKALKPAVTVKNGKTTLKLNTHYTVTYKNNTKIGKATITIKGIEKNGYSGTKTLTFNIIPANVKNLKATQTTSSVKLTWSKVTGAAGYRVFKHDGKKWVKVADTKNTNYTVNELKSGTIYKYAVKAYAKSGNTTYFSASYTQLATATKPGTPTLKATAGAKKASLSWNKQTGASGYVVYMSTSKSGTYKKVATVKGGIKVSCTKTGLTKGKTYYFKVRAYKTVSGTNIYGAYSAVKSVKAK